MFLDEKDMNMDTLLNCLAVACVAVLVNRSEDVLSLMPNVDFSLEDRLDDLVQKLIPGSEFHNENRMLTKVGLALLICLNALVFVLLNDMLVPMVCV